jgi:hypothetical protein
MSGIELALLAVAGAVVFLKFASAPSGTPPTIAVAGSITALSTNTTEVDRVVGDIESDEVDMFWYGDYPDAVFLRQLWLPASRVRISDLTAEDYALAAQFLGLDANTRWKKGGAAGAVPCAFQSAIKQANAQKEAIATGLETTGAVLNMVAKIYGIDTSKIDSSIGFGRGAAELRSQKLDLTNAGGVADDLRKTLDWATPLSRPRDPSNKFDFGDMHGYYLPKYALTLGTLDPFGEWLRPGRTVTFDASQNAAPSWVRLDNDTRGATYQSFPAFSGWDTAYKGGTDYPYVDRDDIPHVEKDGRIRLTTSDARALVVPKWYANTPPGMTVGKGVAGGTFVAAGRQHYVAHCEVMLDRPGPLFRPGLFQLDILPQKDGQEVSALSRVSEFYYPWYSYEMGCVTQGMRDRVYRRARLYRMLDYLATKMFPDPRTDVAGLYSYVTVEGESIQGSIFPPHPDDLKPGQVVTSGPGAGGTTVIKGTGDGATRVVGAPGSTTSAASTAGAQAAAPVAAPATGPVAGAFKTSVLGSLSGKTRVDIGAIVNKAKEGQ